MTEITPARLTEIEEMVGHDTDLKSQTMRDLCAALREVWKDRNLVRGAMAAQDDREAKAGRVCGIPRDVHGCDWPDAVSEACSAALARAEQAERERDEALACVKRFIDNCTCESTALSRGLRLPEPQSIADLRARISAEVWREAAELAGCCDPPGEWNEPQDYWIACARALAAEFMRRAQAAGKGQT